MVMLILPVVLEAEQLRSLDVAGLNEQLGLAQSALDVLHQQKKIKYSDLIEAQNILFDAQKRVHQLKIELKEITNNNSKYLERIKVIKTFIKAEKT